MERIKRNERMAALTKWLTDSPNQIFTLSQFCERFGSAKSTMSEDIEILRQVFETFELGRLPNAHHRYGCPKRRAVSCAA